jgi:hypothetical protein
VQGQACHLLAGHFDDCVHLQLLRNQFRTFPVFFLSST